MNKLTTKTLSLGAVLLLFMAFSASSALAQNYASPNGKSIAAPVAGDCDTFADPCDLATAVREAIVDGPGSKVHGILPNSGATLTFQEDLSGTAEITSDMEFDVSLTDPPAPGFPGTLNPPGIIAVEGDIVIDGAATLTIASNVELRLVGQPGRLEMHDGATIDGPGKIAFTATGGDHLILLGETTVDCSSPATPNKAFIENARVEKTNGDVKVNDECGNDEPSDLFITNWLGVDSGELVMNDNNIHFTADDPDPATGPDPGVDIGGGAVISGSGTAFISIAEAYDPGFLNTHDDCFEISGAGNLNMAFDKNTNGGVCIELDEIGAGGFSFNRAGTLFVTDAIQLNGSFLNEGLVGESPTNGARTEFWALKTITTNLEIVGPGDESCDPDDDFDDGDCDLTDVPGVEVDAGPDECGTDGVSTGNESGVYFFTDVTVEGDLVMTDTDDPDTDDCVEGLWFLGDEDPDDSALAKGADTADHQAFSTIEGDFTSDASGYDVGIYLDSDKGSESFTHNVAFQGDFSFNAPSPVFVLESPADAFPTGDLCAAYSNEANGNKVLFTGGSDQELRYPADLVIPSVQIKKESTNDDVEIIDDEPDTGGTFFIDTSLEIIRGEFVTNGHLDAEGTATVVINDDDDGKGTLEAGDSDRAYISDDDDDTPRKVKYTGSRPHFSGDEIPGDSDGSSEGEEIKLPFLEIFSSNETAVITLGKDFTIGDDDNDDLDQMDHELDAALVITQGILDVGSSEIKLANRLRIEIGDGEISEPDQIGLRGGFRFPTEWIPLDDDPSLAPDNGFDRDFHVGEDGIDLLYFGTSDRTVGLEWPASDTDVDNRDEDSDVIRDVTINNECVDDDGVGIFSPVISLREDDNEYRINGDLIIGGRPHIDSWERADIGGQPAAPGCSGSGCNDNSGTGLGVLDIVGKVLELNATHNFDEDANHTVVEVHGGADLTDSTDELLAATARTAELVIAVKDAMAEYHRVRTAEAAAEMQVQVDLLREAQKEVDAAKTADHAGLLRFIGADRTDMWAGTSAGRLRFDFPAIEVDKSGLGSGDDAGSDARLTLNANGILSTAAGDVAANNPDVIGTSHFRFLDGETGSDDCPINGCGDGGGVELLQQLDILDVGGHYHQLDGEFLMNGLSSIGDAPIKPYIQTVMVGFRFEPGDMIIEDGEFYLGDNDPDPPGANAGSGGNVEVFGDFCLGCTPPDTEAAASKMAADPQHGVFSLAINGTHTVVGDFRVGPDDDPTESPLNVDGRNRYFLGGECGFLPDKGGLFANGNYHFEGTGDRFDDLSWLQQQQGLIGNVYFTGAVEQFVWHRQDEDAFFCDVVMASRSSDNDGIELLANAWQNDMGTLTLEHGVIDVGADSSDWIILNTGFEGDLKNRNNSARGMGVVDLGSRDSYINGEVDRRVEFGNATGGVITGGYLFPTGIVGEGRNDGPVGDRDVDFFRPLILQFPDDLGRAALARVNYVGLGDVGDTPPANAAKASTVITPDDCEWPENNLIVDAGGGETLELDVLSNQFWQVEFDRIPSFDPNVRVEADELPNVFDIKSLRLIQWDCDCTNPRLAGLYDLVGPDPVDDASSALNDFIDSVPNITQEGVDVEACQIIGIASNFLINQINQPENPFGFARVQLIHNSPNGGEVDVYVDGVRVWDDARFQTATGFLPVIGGTHTVDIVPGSAADNSNPVFSQEFSVEHNTDYIVIAHGLVGGDPGFRLVIEDNVRTEALDPDNVDFFLVHGATALGEVDIRELDAVNNNDVIGLLANNFSFDDVVRSLSLTAGVGHNIEIITSDGSDQIDVFRFELQSIAGSAVALTLTGDAAKASPGSTTALSIMGVEADGTVFFPDLITADEPDVAAELPTTFELFGNYPNPFNPSTTISFDLPQTAEVTVEVIDMLGRSVMTLPVQQMEAGAARTVEVNASNLASGAYLYRLIARTATETMVKTGRMMLIK